MKTLKLALGIAAVSLISAGVLTADPLAQAVTGEKQIAKGQKTVFVTGSHIPQKVVVKAIGTNTDSQVRVYTREEMDRTGQFTTQGILAQDPSISIRGR
jgi:hypothetical protein